jgi:hypothetical protein
MDLGTLRWSIVVWGAMGIGCSGESPGGEGHSQSDDEAAIIEEYLVQRGFDLTAVRIVGDEVRVDDDMLLSRRSILDESYELDRLAELEPVIQKGYWNSGSPIAPGSTFHFRFDSRVPTSWRDAFRYAGAQWTAAGAECLTVIEGPGTSAGVITISIGEAGTSATGSPAGAVASFPTYNTHVGSRIGRSIVLDFSVEFSSNTAGMRYLAMHELGHTLGFAHPRAGTLIPQTSSSSTTCGSGGCTASYATVMDYDSSDTTTTADDRNSARRRYKKYTQGRLTACLGTLIMQ